MTHGHDPNITQQPPILAPTTRRNPPPDGPTEEPTTPQDGPTYAQPLPSMPNRPPFFRLAKGRGVEVSEESKLG